MSTKIYSGFKIKAASLLELNQMLEPVLTKIEAAQQSRLNSFLAFTALEYHDAALVSESFEIENKPSQPGSGSYIFQALDAFQARERKLRTSFERDPAIDFEVKLIVWQISGDTFVGMVAAEQATKAFETLISSGVVEDYCYWNNTDQPDDVSDEEWEARSQVWNDIYDKKHGRSFTLSLEEPNGFRIMDELIMHLPSLEGRIERWAHEVVYTKWMNQHKVEVEEANRENKFSVVMRICRELRSELEKDGEWKALKEKAIEDMKGILVHTGEELVQRLGASL